MKVRSLFAVLALAGFAGVPLDSTATHASYLDEAAALNKAGRQRMLSQRIVKSYLQVAEGVAAPAARGQLAEAIWVFDDQLADLKAFATDPETRKTVDAVAERWATVRELATGPVSRREAAAMVAAAERLLEAAERNTAALERHNGRPAAKLVNLAGRQRMLSQRIAKNYLLLNWRGFDSAAIRAELGAARDEFERALGELRAAPESGAEIRAELDAAEAQWQKLKPMLAREHDTAAGRTAVVELADAILVRMERVTGLYERLAKR